jgi:hypothetical protein
MKMPQTKFNSLFKKLLEFTTTDANIGDGNAGPAVSQSADTYAPGDGRLPKVMGGVQTRFGMKPKKRKKKKKSTKNKK